MSGKPRIVCVGEGMAELFRAPGGGADDWQMAHGGDMLDVGVHLARLGCDVAFLSSLGADRFSLAARAAWEGEGLDCSLVSEHPARNIGLYAIHTDAAGERSFTYWRETAAARHMFAPELFAPIRAAAERADLLVFSLISLAILDEAGRGELLALAQHVRGKGGRVMFDGNYRPRLWASREEALDWRNAGAASATMGLPTLEDEASLAGLGDAQAVYESWMEASEGKAEVVVKLGADGCRLPDGTIVPPPARLDPVDTSGAGDAFDAGYLSARLAGDEPAQAALAGHALGGWIVMRRGAIPPVDDAAPYAGLRR
ncbi:MAG: sugar kinase [Erythrobacter sp.]|nr:MAG: sugar kinase [Erythrobacter sp.]